MKFAKFSSLAGLIAFSLGSVQLFAAPGVEPISVSETVEPGATIKVTKIIHTPPIPPKPDIVFLADTTGSMGGAIANVRNNANAIFTAVQTADPTAQFAVANYKDFIDAAPYTLQQTITADNSLVTAALNGWSASGGGDGPEAAINALFQLATAGAEYRPNSTKIIVWFGDAPGHDPSGGHTLDDAINALQAANIRVIAIDLGALDFYGQASAIAEATGGVFLSGATPDTVAEAILTGLANLPITVSAVPSDCSQFLDVSVSPPSVTVVSGQDAVFEETIFVRADAPQCTPLTCDVSWLLDGQPVLLEDGTLDPAFVQTIAINVVDIDPPTVVCVPTTNPSGKNNPKSDHNPDGFYQLLAADNCDGVGVSIYIKDSAEGPCGGAFVAGPYSPGDKVKLTRSPGKNSVKPMAGDIVAHINTKGEPLVVVTDSSGNTTCQPCFVAPLPK